MTNELIRRFDPTAAQRIPASTKLPIVRPISVLMEMFPAIGDRFGCLLGGRLHASQAAKYPPHFAHIEPSQGGFHPFVSLLRYPILCLGHLVEIFLAVVIVENLSGLGK